MPLMVDGKSYRVHIPGPNPFAVMGEYVIGLTPWVPIEMLDRIQEAWDDEYRCSQENKVCTEWDIRSKSNPMRYYKVLQIGEKWLCDCWPFKRMGTCEHIEIAQEDF